ncbi:MAG: transglycosylase domain-containing protein, partial [Eubacterium sp.]
MSEMKKTPQSSKKKIQGHKTSSHSKQTKETAAAKDKKTRGPGKKIGILLLTLLGLAVIGGGITFAVLFSQVPPLDTNNFNYIENAKILDIDGTFYQDLQSSERREVVSIKDIPEDVQNAFIAIEDQRFRTHDGIDIKRLGRAILG